MKYKNILQRIGFSQIPQQMSDKRLDPHDVKKWLKDFDFAQGIRFYELQHHKKFMKMISKYYQDFLSNPEIQYGAYILNNELFSPDKYNWTHNLKRTTIDALPALVLISGYEQHHKNMQDRKFDQKQTDTHKFRINESCVRGIDVYNIPGSEISQLIWGSFFINAHIVEFGRLQYEIMHYDYAIPNFNNPDKFCINIHVPRGGKLIDSDTEKSIQTATQKIPTYFSHLPEHPNYFIESWLMSDNLDKYLPEQSNIRLFRNRFKILKQEPQTTMSKFLFNTSSPDVSKYPSDTYLRKRIKQALLDGEKFHDGIALLKHRTK